MIIKKQIKSKTSVDNFNQKRVEACTHIREAIDALAVIASTDEVAKESIANLGVVALDLSSK